ncbi:protein of unknown function [Serratia sp. Tan611]|nr:protein of unknown function [Serratia sp. Tan611]
MNQPINKTNKPATTPDKALPTEPKTKAIRQTAKTPNVTHTLIKNRFAKSETMTSMVEP